MKDDKQPFIPFSKKGLASLFSAALLFSTTVLIPVPTSAESSDTKKVSFNDDVEWMKSVATLSDNTLTISLSEHYSFLKGDSIHFEATVNNNVTSVSTEEGILKIDIKDFGESTVNITATNDKNISITDHFTINVTKKGDINGDGIITTADVLYIYQVVSGKIQLSDEDKKPLDINGDGVVTNADATVLMSNYVGKKSNTTITNNYFIKLKDINDNPAVTDDHFITDEDKTLDVNPENGVFANDLDPENNQLLGIIKAKPSHGEIIFNEDGSFSYKPEENYYGEDSFSYIASDGLSESKEANVTIKILPVNDAPTAKHSTLTVLEDISANGNLLATDVDQDKLTYAILENGKKGTVTILDKNKGTYSYTPNKNVTGEDTFTFSVTDGQSEPVIAKISISITAVNDAPIAVLDNFTVKEDLTLSINEKSSILLNDTDVDSNILQAVLVKSTSHGKLDLKSDGTFIYIPNPNFNGTDSFTYKANDGALLSDEQIVTITVTPVNDTPLAKNSNLSGTEDKELNGTLLAEDMDGDSLIYSIVKKPSNGIVTITDSKTGTFIYTPDKDTNGNDSFTFKVNDGTIDSNEATVSLSIKEVNDAPVATKDFFTVKEDTKLSINKESSILLNDTDVDNSSLTAKLVKGPSHGTLTLHADGTFEYTPSSNFNGKDSFTYKANDGILDSAEQTVEIEVTPVNDAPVAIEGSFDTEEDKELTGQLKATDIDGDDLTYSLVSQALKGTVTITDNQTGKFTYTPNKDEYGQDSFAFKVNDGSTESETVIISISIKEVNDPPTISDVKVEGSSFLGETLEGTYSYLDVENDLEGSSSFQWYRSKDKEGLQKVSIDGATKRDYKIIEDDLNHYLFFSVTPVAAKGTQSSQTYTISTTGKVTRPDVTAPVITVASPTNNETEVEVAKDFSLEFNESVYADNGTITIYGSDNSPFESFKANDTNHVTIDGNKVTIKHSTLAEDENYHVVIDSHSFRDEAGNYYTQTSNWTFTTVAGNASMTATPWGILSEDTMLTDGITLSLDLQGDTFSETINPTDFQLNNAPPGTEIALAMPSEDFKNVILLIDYDGSDFDSVISDFTVTVNESGTTKGKSVTSNSNMVDAVIEAPSAFFSEYIQGSDFRTALEISAPKGLSDTSYDGYYVEVHQWKNNKKNIVNQKLIGSVDSIYMPYLIIDRAFYDFFDLINTPYYNAEMEIGNSPTTTISAIILKDKSGRVIDVLGNPNAISAQPILSSDGTYVRNPGRSHGAPKYVSSEWTQYPNGTYQYFGYHNNNTDK